MLWIELKLAEARSGRSPFPTSAGSEKITIMRFVLAGIALSLALAAAGCGGSGGSSNPSASGNGEASKSATQVLADAVKAAESASSLHMGGDLSSGGKPIGLDLSVAKDQGATGSMTLNGQKVDLVIDGKDGYMKAPAAFWTQFGGSSGSMIAQLLQGKWLKFPVKNAQFQPIVAFSSPNALFEAVKSGADSQLKNNGTTTYKGQSVVALDDGAKNGTLYVSATGTPYPVALVKTGSGGGTITFGDWNQPVTVTAPADAIDFSHLTG